MVSLILSIAVSGIIKSHPVVSMNRSAFEKVSVFLALLLCIAAFVSRPFGARLWASDASYAVVGNKCIWVFFRDKGTLSESRLKWNMDRYESQLPSAVRARRLRTGAASIGTSDLPVFRPYVDGILGLGANLRVTSRWLNGITVEVPHSLIPDILQLPYVRAVEPVITYRRDRVNAADIQHSHLRLAPNTQHQVYGMSALQLQQIHVDALHNEGYHGEGITLALLDTGFDLSHEALRNVRVLAEYDFVNGNEKTSDDPAEDDIGQDDHGTEVLSVIAGDSPGNLMGVAYAAEYLLAKTERVSRSGVMFEQKIEEDWWVAGIEWAELKGAEVVSSSLGYSDWYSYDDMDGATAKTTIAATMAIEKGVVVVVSAGNDGKSQDWPHISAPADGFDVIAVGAVNAMGELADFSSTGATYDGRIKPDVVALGEDVYVADPRNATGYLKTDGTSLAAPLVAGTVALLLQALPGLDGPKDLAKLLKYTATRALFPDNRYGWGIVNAHAALRYGRSIFEYGTVMEEFSNWDPAGGVSYSRNVILYPNPVRRNSSVDGLKIYSREPMESVRVYSMSGLLIHERQNMNGARFSIWDLKNQHGNRVASGIYICVIRGTNGPMPTKSVAVID